MCLGLICKDVSVNSMMVFVPHLIANFAVEGVVEFFAVGQGTDHSPAVGGVRVGPDADDSTSRLCQLSPDPTEPKEEELQR